MTEERSIHLVGGVPLEASEVFDLAGACFGPLAKRLPDGEKKRGWLRPQAPIIGRAGGMMPGTTAQFLHLTNQRYRPAPGKDPAKIDFGPLGYHAATCESFELFKVARAAGKIAPRTRFQISLPTAFGVMGHAIDRDAIRDVWPVYEAQLFAEIRDIANSIPHRDLAIQWDIAVEITQALDNPKGNATDYTMDELADAVARGLDCLPAGVEGGLHLCYGDAGEDKHYVNPHDTGVMVAFHNAIAERARHSIDWVHMPVPRERDDEAYFAPLGDLRLRPETELILGLIHRSTASRARSEKSRPRKSSFPISGSRRNVGWVDT
jgi:hypothetical protein